ncbi:amidase [Caulobacter sp. 73W]|uniref:Amidase n=1 Tax=Caulobacter sp. 73W TaxID=3161137 RepID=A0AB39KSH7_9CAUL
MSLLRRDLLAAATAASLAPALPAVASARTPWTPDASEVASRIRRKKISTVEAVETAIRHAEALNPKLNFMVTPDYERAMAKAKKGGQTGPFAGVPFLVKDLNDVVGLPTRYGSRTGARAQAATTQDAYVDALERAGFIIIGKSATPEYGFLPTTEPLASGPTRNPWDLNRSSGGSSGGAAAATAAGVVPIAHANDGGGSIRIPAANCGLFGLKPSRARMIPGREPARAIDLAVEHCVSHSVRDSAALFAATENSAAGAPLPPVGFVLEPSKRRLRVGVVVEGGTGLKPDIEVARAVDNAAHLMRGLGHQVEPTKWPIDGEQFARDFNALWGSSAAGLVDMITKAMGRAPDASIMEPFSLGVAELGKAPKGGMEGVLTRLKAAGVAYNAWFDRYDVILSPVLGKPPVELGYVSGDVPFDTLVERLVAYVGYTPLENVAGAPAMSVPLHWTPDGLPVGVQFAARTGDEKTLFELAYELEHAHPWAHRRPPVHV